MARRRRNKSQSTKRAVKEAEARLAAATVKIERLRLARTVVRCVSPVAALLILLIIILFLLYGPADRLPIVNEVLDKLGINKFFTGVIIFLLGLIGVGRLLGKILQYGNPSQGEDV